jgi:hypothetical protein
VIAARRSGHGAEFARIAGPSAYGQIMPLVDRASPCRTITTVMGRLPRPWESCNAAP